MLNLKIGGYETILITLTFEFESGYCNYQSTGFSCDSCSVDHADEALNSNKYKGRKAGADRYLSKPSMHTEMKIQMVGTLCRKIVYSYISMPKEQYKLEYNSL